MPHPRVPVRLLMLLTWPFLIPNDGRGAEAAPAADPAKLAAAGDATTEWHKAFETSTDAPRRANFRPPSQFADFDTARLVTRTMLATTALTITCLVVIWASRRHSARRSLGTNAGGMQLLDSLAIAPRCCLQLVAVDQQRFLIARDGNGVQSVTAVNTFADTLDDVGPAPETVKDRLDSASGAGLSLERQQPGDHLSSLRSTGKDSWQASYRNLQ